MSTIGTATRTRPRLLVVDDHGSYAECLVQALTLRGYEALSLVPRSDLQPADLVSAVLARRIDVVLLDLDLGGGVSGMSVIGPLADQGVHVVVVTAAMHPGLVGDCLVLGARTVLRKTGDLPELAEVIRKIECRQPLFGPDEQLTLVSASRQRDDRSRRRSLLDQLSRRESVVLRMLMSGSSVSEIARRDVVSPATVRTQVRSILAKLEVCSQLAAVAMAYRAGWPPCTTTGKGAEGR